MDVPYHCQWADRDMVDDIVGGVCDARDDRRQDVFGFDSAEEYAFWARRTCGLACLESYLDVLGISRPPRAALVREACSHGAYIVEPQGVKGLIYAPFATWLDLRFGRQARVRTDCTLMDVQRELEAGSLVICSVSSEIRAPDVKNQRKGGHLVLVTACDKHGVRFHNPSGFRANQESVVLDWKTFDRFFARRGIALPTDGDSK